MDCSHDCFRCPYDDCIWPDEDFPLTALEIAMSESLDREAERSGCEADYEGNEDRAAEARRRHRRREWYMEHRASELLKHAEYRRTHKEAKRLQDNAYYLAHREEINRRKRERRALEKARKLAERKKKSE